MLKYKNICSRSTIRVNERKRERNRSKLRQARFELEDLILLGE